jgi:hypothetical protein
VLALGYSAASNKLTMLSRLQVGAAAAVFASRQAALRALRELHRAQLQVEVESEAQVKPWTLKLRRGLINCVGAAGAAPGAAAGWR